MKLNKIEKYKMIEKTLARYEYLTENEEIKRLIYLRNKEQRQDKIAKQFSERVIDINIIAKYAGLSVNEVEKLMDRII